MVALAPCCCAQNLVVNGELDESTTGWYRNHKSPSGAIKIVPREGRQGCVQFASQGEWVDLGQAIELPPSPSVLQMDLRRTAAGQDIRAFVVTRRKNGTDSWYALGGDQLALNQWQHFAREIRPPGDMVSARVLLMNRLKGATAWFDAVQVVPVSDSSAAAADYCPKVTVPRVDTTPVIDGRLQEGEWSQAAGIEGFCVITDGSAPRADTRAWVCSDGVNLLLAARCVEPMMDQARLAVTGHDAGGVFADEVFEVFIDPDNDHETYYHFAVGAAGADYDASLGEGSVDGTEYESGWTAKVSRQTDSWSVEAAIPLSSLTSGSAGKIWGLNLARERRVPEGAENTAWSATGTRFHTPERFGDLVWAQAPLKAAVVCELLPNEDLAPGPCELSVRATSKLKEQADVLLRVDIAGPDGATQTTQKPISLQAGQSVQVQLPFEITERGAWQVALSCARAQSGEKLFTAPGRELVVPPLLSARIVSPWYRGRIFSKMDLKHVQAEARVALQNLPAANLRLEARIVRPAGTDVQITAQATRRLSTLELPCAKLQAGSYTVRVALMGPGGEELAAVEGLQFDKLAPAEDELWFDRENNLHINGRPCFPTGFYSLDWTGRMAQTAEGDYTLFHTYASSTAARLDPEITSWDWQKWLDTGASLGMRAFQGIGYSGDREKDFHQRLIAGEAPEPERRMREFIHRWKTHPGIGAWYLYDEPALAGRTVPQIEYLYNMADSIDPYHPKVICQVFWSDKRFVPYLDVLMPDPYPIRAQSSQPLRSVATAVRAARRTVNDEKPVWPVLQWYRYTGGRYPTPREMRCMAFLAVAAGAKGLTWYSFYHGYKGDSKHWPDMAAIGRELRSVQDIVLAPYAPLKPVVQPEEAPIDLMLKRTDGKLHLVCVNYEDRDLPQVTITLPVAMASAVERFTGDELEIAQGGITLAFKGYEPKVIDIRPAPVE